VFKGNVIAKQGAFTVQTTQMTAHYTGQAGIAAGNLPGPQAKGAAKGDASQGAQLTRIEARQKVIVTGQDQEAIGEWADFDVKSNKITMGGNVTLSQGPKTARNVITGGQGDIVTIDMTTGLFELMKPKEAIAKAVPAVSAAPRSQGGAEPAGTRMRAVIFPKEAQKAGELVKKPGEKKDKTGSSAWDATTSGTKQ
jgi:lipopolysaccharide export system protein LptA